MIQEIKNILETSNGNSFTFQFDALNPKKQLKINTVEVPNEAGLYSVFCEENLSIDNNHLLYEINGKYYTLLYFGKAGGITKSGKKTKQGLNGRINNVVSGDVPRAIYWTGVMKENQIKKFYVFYQIIENPSTTENKIYNFLDSNSKKYPLMNKKRGRKK